MDYAPLEMMKQTVVIEWHDMNTMPSEEGTYLVAFDDGAVEMRRSPILHKHTSASRNVWKHFL